MPFWTPAFAGVTVDLLCQGLTQLGTLSNMLGYPKEELLGKNNREYMDKENARKVYEGFNRVYTTGIPLNRIEYEFISKDGNKRHNEISVTLIRDKDGKPTGFRGIGRDITERKAIELELSKHRAQLEQMVEMRTNELVRTKNFLESIFDSSLEGIITTNTEGMILFVSPRITEIFGHHRSGLTVKNVGMLLEGGEDEAKSIVERLLRNEVMRDHETRGIKKNGEVVDLSLSISLLRDAEGKVAGTTSICRDVTEQKRMANALQQARLKAEAASQAKSQFVANMSEEEKGLNKDRRARVMMVTAQSDKDTVVTCIQAGCDTYVLKPFDKRTIVEKL